MLPAVGHGGGVAVGGVGHAHPTDLNAAARLIGKALGRVVVEAEIRVVEIAEGAVPAPVAVDREVPAAVDVLALDALGGHGQEPLAVQLEQIGALPHKAEGLGCGQRVGVPPGILVLAFQDKHLSPVLDRAGTQHHVIAALAGKDFGVAHMAGQPGGIVLVIHKALLAVDVQPIAADSQADIVAAPLFDVVKRPGVLDVAGVVQVHRAVLDEGRAGVDAVAVERLIGVKHRGLVIPVEQVTAGDMPPVFDATVHIEGTVLEESVVGIANLAQAVGVVEPAHYRLDVEFLAVGVAGGFLRTQEFHQGNQFFQVTL